MTTNYTAPVGAPCWIDLLSSDPGRATEFYGTLFGWTAEPPAEEFGGYINMLHDGVRIAGAMKNEPEMQMPDIWSVYLKSADIEATVNAAEANGGSVMMPVMAIGDLGSMAYVIDVGGATIGVWQPGQGSNAHIGFATVDEPGTPGWFELHTREFAPTVKFYETVFGWDAHNVSDSDEFRYTTLGEGDDQKAGIMDATGWLPDGVPAHWSVYFRVTDTDATLAKVVELGGSVVMPAEDTPYGRLATVADPMGAMFKLVG